MLRNTSRWPWLWLVLGLAAVMLVLPAHASAQSNNPPAAGYYYTVRPGDTWSTVSRQTGVSIARLKAANPLAIHPFSWLWVGDRLYIPQPLTTPQTPVAPSGSNGSWYTVNRGDTWYTVSRATGVSILDLWRANPAHIHPYYWLWIGESLWVPGGQASGVTATATATAAPPPTYTATPSPTATATATASPAATATATPSPTATPTRTPTATPWPTPSRTPSVTASASSATPTATTAPRTSQAAPAFPCPSDYTAYANDIGAYLARADASAAGLRSWLEACGVVQSNLGGVTEAPIQSASSKDLVVVIHDSASGQLTPTGTILVYHHTPGGYILAGRADGTGKVELLRVGDVNADGKTDVVWTDTTCGAHTCFSTLFVDEWDGTAYRDWIEGEPTMAYPDYSFKPGVAGGSGDAILVHGGIIGSVGAGPQRAWTETYISENGAPYHLSGQQYDASPCLYHHILDANQAFNDWEKDGFEQAIEDYRSALDDTSLGTCGTIPDELSVLRDFARFRLLVASIAGGHQASASGLADQISLPALQTAARAFLESYQDSGSIVQACRDTTTYAQAHPESWNYLSDWGYANPGFTAEDLCPLGR